MPHSLPACLALQVLEALEGGADPDLDAEREFDWQQPDGSLSTTFGEAGSMLGDSAVRMQSYDAEPTLPMPALHSCPQTGAGWAVRSTAASPAAARCG